MTTKIDIAKEIADNFNLSLKRANEIVSSVFGKLSESLTNGKGVEIRGFGTFVIVKRKSMKSNITNNIIPEAKKVKFKQSKLLNIKSNA